MNDSDLKQQHDSIIQKLRDVDEQDFQTKTGLVRELIDVSRPLLKKKLISGLNNVQTGEIYIKWDEAVDEEWLLLIYIKNNAPSEGIVIEDKSNPEKNITYELKTTEIFKASDLMVDSLTQLLARERDKNKQD